MSPIRTITTVVGCFLLSMALAHGIEFLHTASPRYASPTWRAAALLHTGLGALAWLFWHRLRGSVDVSPEKLANLQRRKPIVSSLTAVIPSIVVLGGATVLAFSGNGKIRNLASISSDYRYWILWVPFIEEWTYRVGFGAFIRGRLGAAWGSYVSALLFTFVHSIPTFPRLLAGNVSLALGPFLLGWMNEWIYLKTGRIWPAILFHMACNATAVIFTLGDQRWLQWLGIFYS